MVDMERLGQRYESLEDDDSAMTPRILQVQRSDTGFGGSVPYAFDDEEPTVSKPSGDLQLFIRSMSK